MNYDLVDLLFIGALIFLLLIVGVFLWRVMFPAEQPRETEVNRESEINLAEHHGHPDVRQHWLCRDESRTRPYLVGGIHHHQCRKLRH